MKSFGQFQHHSGRTLQERGYKKKAIRVSSLVGFTKNSKINKECTKAALYNILINVRFNTKLKSIIFETFSGVIPYTSIGFINISEYALRTIKKGTLYQRQ